VSARSRTRQTDRPTRINQFKLGIWNKPREISWRGLASARSACPDLTADLRASLAWQPQPTAEKGSRLHRIGDENTADGEALCGEQCQPEVSIPALAVGLHALSWLLPLALPQPATKWTRMGGSGRKWQALARQQGQPANRGPKQPRHPRAEPARSLRTAQISFHFKPVLQSGLDWDLYAFYVACTTHCASQEMTVPATSGLQHQSNCRWPKTRAKPPCFFLSVTLPMAGQITQWFLRPFPALGQHQLLCTG